MKDITYAKLGGITPCKSYHPHGLLGYAIHLCICILAVALFILFCVASAFAQERFTVQSSARSMENAKHAAQIRQIQVKDGQQDGRLDAVESDIDKIADHAWKTLAQCGVGAGASGTGYKITWNPTGAGTWGCIQETDPTVKTFAKTDLPTCSAGQVLRADGTKFICTTSSGTSGFEVDPYVQDFARNTAYTISACASDEILTMTASRLRCVKSRDLSITESDPTVQPFAKAALPNCAAGQVLTTALNGSGIAVLRCVTDSDGGYAETDPSIGTIANSKWCMASAGKIHCNQNPPVLAEADPKIGILTNGNWCRATGGKVVCDQAAPTFTEVDPKIGQLTNTRWCHASGGKVVCDQVGISKGEADSRYVNVAGDTMTGTLTMGGTASIAMGGSRITNLGAPNGANDAATKAYVDSKESTVNISAKIYDSGWFSAELNKSYVRAHGLGGQPDIVQIWYSENQNGTSKVQLVSSGTNYGGFFAHITDVTANQIRIHSGLNFITYYRYPSYAAPTTGYIKIRAYKF